MTDDHAGSCQDLDESQYYWDSSRWEKRPSEMNPTVLGSGR